MALVKRIESRQLGRRGSGPTAEVSLRRESTHHERFVIRHNREMKSTKPGSVCSKRVSSDMFQAESVYSKTDQGHILLESSVIG
jgi:hypothetical protein